MGLELPNSEKLFDSQKYSVPVNSLKVVSIAVGIGKDIGGIPVVLDLVRMPHLLIAGTTGSGKSVGINSVLLSLIYISTQRCWLFS